MRSREPEENFAPADRARGAIVELRGLTKCFGGRAVLRDVTLTIPRGCIVGLLGPNGAGKTTLLQILSGTINGGYRGTVRIEGHPPGAYTKSIVSCLPDKPSLALWMRVRDAVDFFDDFYPDFDRPKARELLGRLGVDQGAKLSHLSRGSLEKVQLVLVMSRAARLYLLDEPIGGVDPAARDVILDTILTQYSENSSVLMATQIIGDVERVFSSVVFLRQGEMVLNEDVDTLREKYRKSVDGLFREVFRCK